jgi:succinate-semialdehyde dehydrogenase/glutarate-semialdehyde dehydrogenase
MAALPLRDEYLLCTKAYLNGAWTFADDGRTRPVLNPATGLAIASVPVLGGAETRRAVAAAAAAGAAWAACPGRERALVLRRWSEGIAANQEDLAVLLTAEQGKPLREARAEVAWAAARLEWFAEEAKRLQGGGRPLALPGRQIVTARRALGVVAVLGPWNEPMAACVRKAAPALAAGCTVVLKPASATPLSALALAELADRAGLPPGVFNVLTGPAGVLGPELAGDARVGRLVLAGPAECSRGLLAACAPAARGLSLEPEGRSNFIVFDDADLDAAVQGALAARFGNTGQASIGVSRFLVQEPVFGAFADALGRAAGALKVGDGLKGDTRQGPLIDERARIRMEERVADAERHGAVRVAGGRRHPLGGAFFQPTVLAGGSAAMALAREPASGPIALLFPFRDEEDLLALANAEQPALASCFYTGDLRRAWRLSAKLDASVVALNQGVLSPAAATGDGAEHPSPVPGPGETLDGYLAPRCLCVGGTP